MFSFPVACHCQNPLHNSKQIQFIKCAIKIASDRNQVQVTNCLFSSACCNRVSRHSAPCMEDSPSEPLSPVFSLSLRRFEMSISETTWTKYLHKIRNFYAYTCSGLTYPGSKYDVLYLNCSFFFANTFRNAKPQSFQKDFFISWIIIKLKMTSPKWIRLKYEVAGNINDCVKVIILKPL